MTNYIGGMLLGLLIGAGFATLQWRAQRRAERSGQASRLAQVPGSFGRVAVLFASLALVQVFCPGVSLWSVSAGVLAGTALPIYWRLQRLRRTAVRLTPGD